MKPWFFCLQHATTAIGVDIFPETVKNPKRKESNAATTVAKLAMWHETVTMPMSRSATPAGGSDTSRSYVTKSSVTGKPLFLTHREHTNLNHSKLLSQNALFTLPVRISLVHTMRGNGVYPFKL